MNNLVIGFILAFASHAAAASEIKMNCFGQVFIPNESDPQAAAESARPFNFDVDVGTLSSHIVDDRLADPLKIEARLQEMKIGPSKLYILTTTFIAGESQAETSTDFINDENVSQHLSFKQGKYEAFVNCLNS